MADVVGQASKLKLGHYLEMPQSIAFIMDHYGNPYAGTEGQVFKLVESLKTLGWEVHFAVFRSSEYVRSGQFPVTVEVLNIQSIKNPGDWLKLYRYAKTLKRNGVRIAHMFFNDASVMAPPVLRWLGIKTIISRRDMGFWYSGLLRKVLPWTGRSVDACICNSQAVKEMTEEVERIPGSRISVIYNGYPELEPFRGDILLHKKRSESWVVGLVANLRPIKRIDDLIRATALLNKEGIELEAHVVGGGDSTPLLALATELGIADRCVFWGSQSQVEAFLTKFDVAVLCSESEGFSNAIIEYMRAGKPVVCTKTGGNPEIVDDGVNGYLVEVGDYKGLAVSIAKLLQNPDQAAQFGEAGRRKVLQEYSLKKMIQDHERIYSDLLGQNAA